MTVVIAGNNTSSNFADRLLGELAMQTEPPPGMSTVLWNLSTPSERSALLEQANAASAKALTASPMPGRPEISDMQPMMLEDIVVVGRRSITEAGGSTLWYQDIQAIWHRVDYRGDGSSTDTVSETPPPATVRDDPNDKSDTVKVSISNAANKEEALKAANNLAEGIAKYKGELMNEDPARKVTINGKETTAGAELSRIKNTEFSITDKSYTNGGVGAAITGENGAANRVEINFEHIDGDGDRDYAHPNYQNMEGVVGIIGHEMGHLTPGSATFEQQNRAYLARENGVLKQSREFNNTEYWTNNEAWANAYSKGLANAFGMDIDTWIPNQGFSYRPPNVIYNENVADLGLSDQVLR